MKKKLLILIPMLITCFVLFTAQSSEPLTKTLERNYTESGFDLNVNKVLGDFKQTLLDNKILDKRDFNDPSAIYTKLAEIEESVNPLDYDIQGFIDKKPLSELLESADILSLNTQAQADIALFTYYQVFSARYCLFELHLTDKRLVEFRGDNLPIISLESVLFEAIEGMAFRNVRTENVKIVLRAEPSTPNEYVNFILRKLADMGLRGFKYGR